MGDSPAIKKPRIDDPGFGKTIRTAYSEAPEDGLEVDSLEFDEEVEGSAVDLLSAVDSWPLPPLVRLVCPEGERWSVE
jgi:hypothetical protein